MSVISPKLCERVCATRGKIRESENNPQFKMREPETERNSRF